MRLNNEILEDMVRECEDFIRLSENKELTNEDLQIMLDDIKRQAQALSFKVRYELNN